jgi:hypothetical protein
MNLLITIMAHAGGQAAFDRHMPYWQSNAREHQAELLVTCPVDAQVKTDRALILGKAEHHGVASILRFRAILTALHRLRRDWYVLFEYDSLCLTPRFPNVFNSPALWANAFDNNTPDPKFRAMHYFHPPLIFDWYTLNQITQAMMNVANHAEQGFWDRWLGLVSEIGKITWRGYDNVGFAKNTIEPQHFPELKKAIAGGAVMIHGIKTEQALKACQVEKPKELPIVKATGRSITSKETDDLDPEL